MTVPTSRKTLARSKALKKSRQAKMAQWFKRRYWRVCTDLTFENDDLDVQEGEFWVKGGKVFRTPFGNKGTHGYILQEVNAKGEDVWRGTGETRGPSRAPFGWVTLSHAAEMFPGCIDKVPPRPYGQPGGIAAERERQKTGSDDPGL